MIKIVNTMKISILIFVFVWKICYGLRCFCNRDTDMSECSDDDECELRKRSNLSPACFRIRHPTKGNLFTCRLVNEKFAQLGRKCKVEIDGNVTVDVCWCNTRDLCNQGLLFDYDRQSEETAPRQRSTPNEVQRQLTTSPSTAKPTVAPLEGKIALTNRSKTSALTSGPVAMASSTAAAIESTASPSRTQFASTLDPDKKFGSILGEPNSGSPVYGLPTFGYKKVGSSVSGEVTGDLLSGSKVGEPKIRPITGNPKPGEPTVGPVENPKSGDSKFGFPAGLNFSSPAKETALELIAAATFANQKTNFSATSRLETKANVSREFADKIANDRESDDSRNLDGRIDTDSSEKSTEIDRIDSSLSSDERTDKVMDAVPCTDKNCNSGKNPLNGNWFAVVCIFSILLIAL